MRVRVLSFPIVMLSETQIGEYGERGYLILRARFDAAELEIMKKAFDRLEERAARLAQSSVVDGSLFVVERHGEGPVRIERIVWCGGAEPELGRLGRTRRLLGPAAELLGGPELDQLVNQAHIKRPGDGVAFEFHQDSYHRRYGTELFTDVNGRGSFVQTLTALDAMNAENGGLWVVPGSHRAGHIPTVNGCLPEGAFDRRKAVAVDLEPRDVLLLSPFTVHGSGANASDVPRRLFINGFSCAGANRREYPGAGTGLRLNARDAAA